MADDQRTTEQGKWDHLIGQLHALREASGHPSYAELTRRIVAQRMAQGQSEHEARIAKSSVHDAFRLGRQRINPALVRELVAVMDTDVAVVDQWIADSLQPVVPEPEPAPDPIEPASRRAVALLMVGCIVLNMLGREFIDFFTLPLYLDMVGTCIAAVALGPWRGAVVGLATNVVGVVGSGWISLPFALVNVVGALVWGYGVRRYGMSKTLPRYFLLNMVAALACTLVAVPVIVTFLGGELRAGHDIITQVMQESVDTFLVAVGFSNLLTSLADKFITGFVALVAVSALPVALRLGVSLPITEHTQRDSGSDGV